MSQLTTKLKNNLKLLFLLLPLIFVGFSNNSVDVCIIPEPAKLEVNYGYFNFNEKTYIVVEADNPNVRKVADYFADRFSSVSGYSLKILTSSDNQVTNNFILFTDKKLDSSLGPEGYTLRSDVDKIILTGTSHGLFYGVQTLLQLLPKEIFSSKAITDISWKIPSVEIKDVPRFKWRGMHLDVGRHMFPVSFIKKYIDYIAMHKLNTFHWHLTEDQGWRIEIKRYPKLTEIGAWRKGTQIGKTDKIDNKKYGGYYTQDEIKEIVKYADERFVTVIPEIEMPGHSVAALASYPELSCTGDSFEVRSKWGVSDDIYCAGSDSVFTFLENVLTEVMELFPSKYIHIGGDEAPKTRWEKCPKCQLRIKNEGLKDEDELQSYFIGRIEKFLNSKGRQIIGWDEILEGGLAPNAAVMSWRGIEGGISAAKQQHNVVMTPTDYCYFDYYQGEPEFEPLAIGGFLPLEKVYSYEPIPEALNSDEEKYIIGVQANQWTEYITTQEMLEYMTLPRLCSLAEIAWSPKEKRNLPNFLQRMSTHYERLDVMVINYRWPGLSGLSYNNVFIDEATVDISSGKNNTEIRYTINGSEPTQQSLLYREPFKVNESMVLKVKEFSSEGNSSHLYEVHYIKEKPAESITLNTTKNGLNYKYYELSDPIHSTIELLKLKPIQKGKVEKFVFPNMNNELHEKFGVIYNGFIKIPSEDVYTFSVLSNDGSRLYVADKLVVDNDGPHGAYEKHGGIALQAGWHNIKLLYFQAGGGKTLNVFMKNSRTEKREISKSILKH